jgi:uncharacterized protein (TIGR02270 family)
MPRCDKSLFSAELYCSHLEEIDLLLSQRFALFRDPEVEWLQVADFEERLMAHLDGIVIGGEEAVKVAAEYLRDIDSDIIAGAALALAYSEVPYAIDIIFEELAKGDEKIMPAYILALKYPPNKKVSQNLITFLSNPKPILRAAALEILGYRRDAKWEMIAKGLDDSEPAVIKAAISAAIRIRDKKLEPMLRNLAGNKDISIAHEAVLAILLLGSKWPLDYLRGFCMAKQEDYGNAPIYLALSSDLPDCDLLMKSEGGKSAAGTTALGIIGNIDSIDFLLSSLKSEDDAIKISAAESLQLITGANLTEEHIIQEEWPGLEDDTVETEETAVMRISTSYNEWSVWWNERHKNYDTKTRWRLGKPFSETVLIDEIADPKSSFIRRQRAYWELCIGFGTKVDFEPDWFVEKQLMVIEEMRLT